MYFPSTHWSLLAKATVDGEAEARTALSELCRRYWWPLRQFIRWRGYSETEAEDLTQEFLMHLLERSTLRKPDPARGKFRSFLLGALVKFLSHERQRRLSLKRGGQSPHVSLEELCEAGAPPLQDGEVTSFDRSWALAIMRAALERLERDYAEAGRTELFTVLRAFLPGGTVPPPYEAAAARTGLSLAAFNSEVHRLRYQFRKGVRTEVLATVSAPHEVDEELGHLYRVLMDGETDLRSSPER